MNTNLQTYYCYLLGKTPVVEIDRPDHFVKLSFHYSSYCPNKQVANQIFQAYLKIMELREDRQVA